jgi:hypothetical protein
MGKEMMCQLVGRLIDLAISEIASRSSLTPCLHHAYPVRDLLGIGRKYLVDC